ncbi:hypothetical protein P1X15_16930 [Runella sp. MFBS21]|uniref:hypothetical protein n=1 Tax=Runella sp. MFBS21 TaxID=3034018 RepID=UPI0023FA147E|nr:hypothetical protein [Runella sp. MFBS21]MDF7819304.1 hypothetical protein [Runella sp. MFBS21]
MKLIDFIKRKWGLSLQAVEIAAPIVERVGWTGQDFEFLIVGEINVFSDFDQLMTPNSLEWTKTHKNGWDYYQVGQDEFSYSFEEPGIQMTFNEEISFDKAKKIGDEVILNIHSTGQKAELFILDKRKVYRLK